MLKIFFKIYFFLFLIILSSCGIKKSWDESGKYTINKDSQIGLTIISNPIDVQSVISLGGEGDGLQFHMSGVPEEYVINIYDINDILISSQDNNHINAELSTYAEWGGMISDDEISPGIYRLQLLSNNILKMRSIIVVSH